MKIIHPKAAARTVRAIQNELAAQTGKKLVADVNGWVEVHGMIDLPRLAVVVELALAENFKT